MCWCNCICWYSNICWYSISCSNNTCLFACTCFFHSIWSLSPPPSHLAHPLHLTSPFPALASFPWPLSPPFAPQVILLTAIFKLRPRVFPGGCRPARAEALHCLWHLYVVFVFFDFLILVWVSTGPGRHALVFVLKFHVECNQNHVWGPLGARDMSIFCETCVSSGGRFGWWP